MLCRPMLVTGRVWSVAFLVRAWASTIAAAATLTSVAPDLQPVGQGRALWRQMLKMAFDAWTMCWAIDSDSD